MAEKASADVTSHNEGIVEVTTPAQAETAGRRQSVAINIVENPLMVSPNSPFPLRFYLHEHGH